MAAGEGSQAPQSASRRTGPAGHWPVTALTLAYVAVNSVIWVAADPSCRRVGGSCYVAADNWAGTIADALLLHGALVQPDNPTEPWTLWPPGGGILEAIARFLAGGDDVSLYILLQLVLVFATGMLIRSTANRIVWPSGEWAMALFIFNPNVLTLAHLPQNEIPQMFLVTVAFLAVLRYASEPRVSLAVGCGVVLGTSAMIRPDTAFLGYALPAALPLVVVLAGTAGVASRAIWHGAIGAVAALAVMAPWMAYVAASGEGFRMSDRGQEVVLFRDNLRFLTPDRPGRQVTEARGQFYATQEQRLSTSVENWGALSERERSRHRLADVRQYFLSGAISPGTYAIAFAYSVARILFGTGQSWTVALFSGADPDEGGAAPVWYAGVALLFVVATRLLALAGMVRLVLWRRYDLLAACLGLFGYFLAIHLVNGQSRYRIVFEPELALLSSFGATWLSIWLQRVRSPSPDKLVRPTRPHDGASTA